MAASVGDATGSGPPVAAGPPPRRRGSVLRTLANAFLALLLADAALTLVDWVCERSIGIAFLGPLRGLVAFGLGVCVFAVFTVLHVSPRYAIATFLPPCLLVSWLQLGAMPLPIWFGLRGAVAVAALLQAGLALWLYRGVRARTGSWLFDEASLAGPNFSRARIGGFALFVVLGLLPGTALYLYWAAGAALSHFTGGFLRMDTQGVYAADRTYVHGADRVRLIATMHVASSEYYRQILATVPGDPRTVTLAEGVSDREHLLPGLDYSGVAATLGLASQSKEWSGWQGEIRRADIDVSDLSPPTIEFLQKMTGVLDAMSSGDGLRVAAAYSRLAEQHVDPERFFADVLEQRNAHLLREIEFALLDYDLLIVPWGAAHMRGVEQGVIDLGFERVDSETREWRVVTWSRDAR